MAYVAQANRETCHGATVRAVKLTINHLPGDMNPRIAIRCPVSFLSLKPCNKLALLLAQHVLEFRRAGTGGRHFQLIANGFKLKAESDSFMVKFQNSHKTISSAVSSSLSPFSVV
jgi:hypothetical protein